MNWLGLDIGGANLKLANAADFAITRPFALWKQPERLVHELRELLAQSPPATHLAMTMTGELADCFESKQQGVAAIVDAFMRAAEGRHQRVYRTDSQFVTPMVARETPALVAAANWHALASFCTRYLDSAPGLLVDIGSTTTDIIPFDHAGPQNTGGTDTQRLCHHELLYTGVERTPVCALVSQLAYREEQCGVAQEMFATTQDAYLVLRRLAEDPTCRSTADGRPATKAQARRRLGRMICADQTEFNHLDAARMAEQIAGRQEQLVAEAIRARCDQMPRMPAVVVISGKGEFLARHAVSLAGLEVKVVSLASELGTKISSAATAHALATLGEERTRGASTT